MFKKWVTAAAVTALLLTGIGTQAQASPAAEPRAATTADKAVEIWHAIESRYVDLKVTETGPLTRTITFADHKGTKYEYSFDVPENAANGDMKAEYKTTWTSWQLNRRETLELARDGADAAVIYAIAAAAGCGACVVGAVIEGYWSTQANAYYNRGNCAEIKFWLAIREYSGGYCR
ncbi:hypothetical protein [Lentzea nigeriaca]|uniref:hypothetical protein n=1 Tax=Lentzea nigeriaca TaxID=1128665 RepID=UPI00195684AE|nr:hypothetical protein [Lentzea nigeriaca]MBM7858615.1 hypothetical protein [Lentzea nigeriaca]